MRSLYCSPWGTYKPTFSVARFVGRKTQKRLLRLFPPSHAYDISVDGIRLRCHLNDNATERDLIVKGARQDREELSAILQCLTPVTHSSMSWT